MFASLDVNGFAPTPAPVSHPCPAFPVAVRFPDVGPEVLAREAASEASRVVRPDASLWHAYLRRVVPDAGIRATERHDPADMARAVFAGGTGATGLRTHATRMRRSDDNI